MKMESRSCVSRGWFPRAFREIRKPPVPALTSLLLHRLLHIRVIVRCEPPDEEDYKAGVTRRQIVMEFDMQTWKVGEVRYPAALPLLFLPVVLDHTILQLTSSLISPHPNRT